MPGCSRTERSAKARAGLVVDGASLLIDTLLGSAADAPPAGCDGAAGRAGADPGPRQHYLRRRPLVGKPGGPGGRDHRHRSRASGDGGGVAGGDEALRRPRARSASRGIAAGPYPRRDDVAAIAAYVNEALAPSRSTRCGWCRLPRTFSGELALEVGGREIRLIEVGPAHTPGDLIAWVPDAQVAVAADILFVGVTPILGGSARRGGLRLSNACWDSAPSGSSRDTARFAGRRGAAPDRLLALAREARAAPRCRRLARETARELVLGEELAERGFADWLAASGRWSAWARSTPTGAASQSSQGRAS